MYQSTKTYGHELGLSACFRQHRADSHCNLLHGYALSFKFVFEAETLDDRNWVQDFGGLKALKELLVRTFDHKLLVAQDDPSLAELRAIDDLGLAHVMVMPAVGCEAFAKEAFGLAAIVIADANKAEAAKLRHGWQPGKLSVASDTAWQGRRVRVVSCECAEHGANSATYIAAVQA